MTEREWHKCLNPDELLNAVNGKVSNRKLWLFSVACCRRIWHLFEGETERRLVAEIERLADESIDLLALETLTKTVRRESRAVPYKRRQAILAPTYVIVNDFGMVSTLSIVAAAHDITHVEPPFDLGTQDKWWPVIDAEKAAQSELMREVVLFPGKKISFDSNWLRWNASLIRNIAQTIYTERRFTDMPILADALEEAGCADPAILRHCREPGEHVRGCWVLDLLLGYS